MFSKENMEFRKLGNSGLLVSAISFGFWVNSQSTVEENEKLIRTCLQNGINYFDTAEYYSNGLNEEQLGVALKRVGENRSNFVISSKIWVAKDADLNSKGNTNKKHIRESMLQILKRLQLEWVDIIYAHSYDQTTPLQEICRAFHEVIEEGQAFYWGTSNWDADKIFEAFQICEKYNLHKPIAAQNQYNMINRKQSEEEYRTLFDKYRYGLVAFSPLMGGFLTGKYIDQQKVQGRYNAESTSGIPKQTVTFLFCNGVDLNQTNEVLKQLSVIAEKELNCKLLHLAIAWVLKFKHTSTALIGARNVEQLQQTIKAVEVAKKLTPELEARINKILNTQPNQRMDWKSFTLEPHVRPYE